MQLGFMSNMLRGLPMQATTTQQYQAQPNLSTQAISGLGTAAGAYKAFGFKEGGSVKGLKIGGLGDRTGMAQQSQAAQGIKAQLMAMPTDQVAQVAQTSPSETVRAMANEVLMEKRMQAQAEQQAEQSIAQDQMPRGLAAAPAPSMDTLGAAGGGIVAFAGEDESLVTQDDEYIERVKRMREQAGVTGSPIDPAAKALYEKRLAELPGRSESDTGLNMIDFFSRMNKPGSTLSAGIAAAGEALPGITARRKEAAAEELAATSGLAGLTQAERAEMLGISKEAMGLRKDELDREVKMKAARVGAGDRKDSLDKSTAIRLAFLTAPVEQGGLGLPNNAGTQNRARIEAINEQNAASPKLDLQRQIAGDKAVADDGKLRSMRMQQRQYDPKDKEWQEIQDKMDAQERGLRAGYIKPDLGGTKPAAPAPSKSDDKLANFSTVVVQTPAGPISFPNKEAAEKYKEAAGLK